MSDQEKKGPKVTVIFVSLAPTRAQADRECYRATGHPAGELKVSGVPGRFTYYREG